MVLVNAAVCAVQGEQAGEGEGPPTELARQQGTLSGGSVSGTGP